MITADPETNRWNEGQLIPETLISAVAQLVGEADYIHRSQVVAEHALRADNGQADMIHELSLSCYAAEIVKG
jgi:hypothetical protein